MEDFFSSGINIKTVAYVRTAYCNNSQVQIAVNS